MGLKSCLGSLVVVGLVSVPAYGFVTPTDDMSLLEGRPVAPSFRVIRPEVTRGMSLESSAFNGANVSYDVLSGAPRLIAGVELAGRTIPESSQVERFVEVATAFVEANRAELGISIADLELNHKATLLGQENQFLKFRVYRDGVLIQDAGLDFRFKKGKLVQVVNQSFSEATLAASASGEAPRLLEQAEAAVLGDATSRERDVYRVETKDGRYSLVKVTEFGVRDQSDKPYLVQVESATGRVFEVRPTTFYLEGQASGSVYPRYYGDQAVTVPYPGLELYVGSRALQTDLSGRFQGGVGSDIELQGFNGEKVRVVPKTGPKDVLTTSQSGSKWIVSFEKGDDPAHEDKAMSQSMVYVHLNKIVAQAKRYISADWLDEKITANANLPQSCNAYWDGTTVNFFSAGKGCANTGLIADVMYHEWGHGLDQNTGGIDDGALSEGISDVVALTITQHNVVGRGFKLADGSGVRDLETLKVYPKDSSGDPHKEGLIIGGAFWDLFKELRSTYGASRASDLLAKYTFNVIFTAARYTDVYDALLVIDSEDGDLDRKSANLCAINQAFLRHGLAKADPRCRN